jgi:hypothetical protein
VPTASKRNTKLVSCPAIFRAQAAKALKMDDIVKRA